MAIFAEKLRARLAKSTKSFLFHFLVNRSKKYQGKEDESIPRWLIVYLYVVFSVSFGIIMLLDPNNEFFPDDPDFFSNSEKDETDQQQVL